MRAITLGMGLFAGALLAATAANAQATRTWVSGVGDDANPCSRTAPCKTFAGAISKTAAGGEINCLDPAGYGALTINKSLSVVCDYTEGGVLASGNGFVITAAATDNVYLSGLDFHGVSPPTNGINILSARSVVIKNSSIRQFVTGINVQPSSGFVAVSLVDVTVANNTTGISVRPTGSGSVRMTVERSRVLNNSSNGLLADGSAPTSGSIDVTIRDSNASHNGGSGFGVLSSGAGTQLSVDSSMATANNNGLSASGAGAIVRFARSNLLFNNTGVSQVSGGSALSYSPASNTIDGNGSDGTFGTTPFK